MPRPTLRDVHPQNQALTNISIAYRNSGYVAEQVFPIVPVMKKSDFYYVFDKGVWFRDRSATRAPATRAPEVDYTLSTASYLCINDSLATVIPDEVRQNADSPPLRPDITAANYVTDGLLLGLEIRVADLISTSTNWANASNPSTKWSSNTSEPWDDIDTGRDAVVQSIGRMPNTAVMSWGVWRHLARHPDFIDRVKYTRNTGRVEPEDLRAWFGFDRIFISTAMKDTSQEGASESRSYVWGDMFWMGYVPTNAALEEPAAGYVFRWGNRVVQRFRRDEEHADVVTAEWFTDEVITASDSAAIWSDVT